MRTIYWPFPVYSCMAHFLLLSSLCVFRGKATKKQHRRTDQHVELETAKLVCSHLSRNTHTIHIALARNKSETDSIFGVCYQWRLVGRFIFFIW